MKMALSNPGFRYKIDRLLTLIAVWMVIAVILAIQKHLMLHSSLVSAHDPVSFLVSLKSEMFGAFLGAVVGGGLMVFVFHDRFRDKKLINSILFQISIYLPMILSVTMIASFLFNSLKLGMPFWKKDVAIQVMQFMGSADHLVVFMSWSIILVLTIWVMAISEKFGPRQLTKMLLGKYHQPIEETRIFMFIDLKSSTTIAEKLGHKLYFQLLKKCFDEITEPILLAKGEIYQYIGDEVVVSWTLKNGLTNNNCISCFYNIKDQLNRKKHEFIDQFGIIPEFKAGIHVGKVMVGEVGMAKRERVFSGDVLNTASRIQGKCNEFSADLLISGELAEYLDSWKGWQVECKGAVELRGKNSFVQLYAVAKGSKLYVQKDLGMATVA